MQHLLELVDPRRDESTQLKTQKYMREQGAKIACEDLVGYLDKLR